VENTAPPFGVSKNTRSARTAGSSGPGTTVAWYSSFVRSIAALWSSDDASTTTWWGDPSARSKRSIS